MLPDLIYDYQGVEQHIVQCINTDYAFPEKIRIVKAELFTFNKKRRPHTWKDGTGRINPFWTFPTWLRIYDEDGTWGEGRISPDVWQEFVPMMLSQKEALTNLEWRRIFYWWHRGRRSAYRSMSNMEFILFDLIAKKRGVPLHRMLGAERDWCSCYKGGVSVLRTDDELVEELLKNKEEGFKATKMKIALKGYDIDWDLRRVELARKTLGDDFELAVDANEAWDAETSMRFVRDAYKYNIMWFEEPIMQMELEEHRKLLRMMEEEGKVIPLAVGEGENLVETFRAYAEMGCQVLMPSPSLYTLGEFMKVVRLGHEKGLELTTGQGWDIGLVLGTLLNPEEKVEFHRPNHEFNEDYFSVRSTIKDGKMYLPNIPGLPVRVNMEKLEKDGILEGIKILTRQ